MTDITITDSAQTYLNGLLEQDVEGIGVRLFVSQPGTMYAETCLAYCRPGEEKPEDERFEAISSPRISTSRASLILTRQWLIMWPISWADN